MTVDQVNKKEEEEDKGQAKAETETKTDTKESGDKKQEGVKETFPKISQNGSKDGQDSQNDEKGESSDGILDMSNPDPYYPPIIYLPEVDVPTGEEDEEELIRIRCKLYRYASECDPPEWKVRGTGDIKIMKHKETSFCRIVMRRDKTLKLCANHYIVPWMQLRKKCDSEKAFVWRTKGDFADEEEKPETLAVRFATEEKAQKFAAVFEDARTIMLTLEAERIKEKEKEEVASSRLASDLEKKLKVKESAAGAD